MRHGHLVEVDDDSLDDGEAAPGYGCEAGTDEQGQDETLPVGIPPQRTAERLLDGLLLKHKEKYVIRYTIILNFSYGNGMSLKTYTIY